MVIAIYVFHMQLCKSTKHSSDNICFTLLKSLLEEWIYILASATPVIICILK